jgi:transaldolase
MIAKKLGKNTYIKIPTIPEGLKAMRILHEEGYNITATAIYTPLQGYLAAKAGADYTAPYVNRIDNLGTNGIEVTRKIHDIFKNNNFTAKRSALLFTSHFVRIYL